MRRTAGITSLLLVLGMVTASACSRSEPRAASPTASSPRYTSIEWLRNVTPTGDGGGTPGAAYIAFMQGRCSTTLELSRTERGDSEVLEPLPEPLRGVFEGAAAACLAALHGRGDLWETATSSAARVRADELTCWDRSVFHILDTLVKAHEADPETRFRKSEGPGAEPCPALAATDPAHGPAEGGYPIVIRGRNLPERLELHWNGDELITADRIAPDTVRLLVPPAGAAETSVTIKISGAPRIEGVYAAFTYDR